MTTTLPNLALLAVAHKAASAVRNDFETDLLTVVRGINQEAHIHKLVPAAQVYVDIKAMQHYTLMGETLLLNLGSPTKTYAHVIVPSQVIGAVPGACIGDVLDNLANTVFELELAVSREKVLEINLTPAKNSSFMGVIHIGYANHNFTTHESVNSGCLSEVHKPGLIAQGRSGFFVSFALHSDDDYGYVQYFGLEKEVLTITSMGRHNGDNICYAFHRWSDWNEKVFRYIMQQTNIPEPLYLPLLAIYRQFGGIVTFNETSIKATLKKLGLTETECQLSIRTINKLAGLLTRIPLGTNVYYFPTRHLLFVYEQLKGQS